VCVLACVRNDDSAPPVTPPGGGSGELGPLVGCAALSNLDLGPDDLAIVDLDPAVVSPIVTDVFARYAALVTLSGRRIHVVAQSGVSDPQIRRAREVLRQHLTDVPGTTAGAAKGDVANAVSLRCGTIAIFRDAAAYDLSDPRVATFDGDFGAAYVPLFADRVVVEGTPEYLAPDPAWDQTFGATAVLVYRLGLVTERPDWTQQLRLAEGNALVDGSFSPNGADPYLFVEEAFLGVVLESHAGVWAHDPAGDGSAQFGVYAFGSRPALEAGDASTFDLLEDFFGAEHGFDARLHPAFTGVFELELRVQDAYTNRSQYLTNVRLLGSLTSELRGSDRDESLTGNLGNNVLEGRGGDDALDGGDGVDAAEYAGLRAEFTVIDNGDGTTTVQHDVQPGLGVDVLRNVELVVFDDEVLQL
jgi:hypothetical protein